MNSSVIYSPISVNDKSLTFSRKDLAEMNELMIKWDERMQLMNESMLQQSAEIAELNKRFFSPVKNSTIAHHHHPKKIINYPPPNNVPKKVPACDIPISESRDCLLLACESSTIIDTTAMSTLNTISELESPIIPIKSPIIVITSDTEKAPLNQDIDEELLPEVVELQEDINEFYAHSHSSSPVSSLDDSGVYEDSDVLIYEAELLKELLVVVESETRSIGEKLSSLTPDSVQSSRFKPIEDY